MTFDEFFAEVSERNVELALPAVVGAGRDPLDNEALFHLPLLAMTILMLSKSRSRPRVERLGLLVGECMERTFSGFVGSAQLLGWSASLRVRTIQALTFLEMTKLVSVEGPEKSISATPQGLEVLDKALRSGTDLGHTLSRIARAQRNISAEAQRMLG